MRRRWRLIAILAAVILVYLVHLLFFSGTAEVANESVRYELTAIGQSIYEYHTLTGKWPNSITDLERTSLSMRQRYWELTLQNGSIVVVWNEHLSPNPADNRNLVLAYHDRGSLALFGRQWVVWGDLRTEYLDSKKLKEQLRTQAQ